MRAGDVFRFTGIADIHLWMVISDPSRDPEKVVMVNFTTWEPHIDQACVIEVGEHPFIIGRTLINYARARIVADAALEQLRSAGRLQMLNDQLSEVLLTKIRECAMNSITLPLEAGEILIDQDLVD